MLIKILGWYSFIILILGVMGTIVKDGESTTKYTGTYKLISLMLTLPILYLVGYTLFNLL